MVLSAGAINGPELLLRSEIDPSGRTGRRTFLHPVVASIGIFPHRVEAWRGAPQSVASRHFADRGPGKVGFFLETAPVHPMLAATALGGFGAAHQALMARLPHAAALIGLAIDGFADGEEGGTVSLRRDGRVRLDYPIAEAVWEAVREASKAMARIQLAAGAEEVWAFHEPPLVMRREADVAQLDGARWEPGRVPLFTAHQMGGCAMGRDPGRSVVDSRLRHHHLENLWVVDGSVFPTGLGVNPQETIFALGRWAAEHVAAA